MHSGATVLRIAAAILLSTITAVPAGICLGLSGKWKSFFSPLVYILYTVPKISVYPLAIILLGLNSRAAVFIMSLVLFFQILIAVRDKSSRISRQYFLSLASIGGRKMDNLRYIVIPSVLTSYFTALRIGISAAIAVAFFTESASPSSYGLGNFVMTSWSIIDYPMMAAGIAATAAVGIVLYSIAGYLERRFVPWGRTGKKY